MIPLCCRLWCCFVPFLKQSLFESIDFPRSLEAVDPQMADASALQLGAQAPRRPQAQKNRTVDGFSVSSPASYYDMGPGTMRGMPFVVFVVDHAAAEDHGYLDDVSSHFYLIHNCCHCCRCSRTVVVAMVHSNDLRSSCYRTGFLPPLRRQVLLLIYHGRY